MALTYALKFKFWQSEMRIGKPPALPGFTDSHYSILRLRLSLNGGQSPPAPLSRALLRFASHCQSILSGYIFSMTKCLLLRA
jgi:hypothetical protein